MKTAMLYHAEAVGASGYLTLPVQETMEIQASIGLPINGGHGKNTVGCFRYRNVLSFDCAEASVVGSFSEKDDAHGSASMAIIEGLNILDVVTCDRIVARITSKHPANADPSIIPMGSLFDNLRIAGYPITPDLSIDTFTQLENWKLLNDAYANNPAAHAQLDKQSLYKSGGQGLPTSKGVYGCTLVRDFGPLPGGLTVKDNGIYVPHFGTVYLGEFYVSHYSRRILMLHVDLGCSTEGCFGVGSGGGNGSPWP
jgi:hypothetical protein